MFRIILVALATLALAVTPVGAQERTPSARQLELARKYVQQVQGADIEEAIRETVRAQASARGKSNLSSEEQKALESIVVELGADFVARLLDRMAPIYARTFTEAELEAVIAFNETPIGRSILSKTISLASEQQLVLQELFPDFIGKLIVRLCALEKCTPEQLEQFRAEAGLLVVETSPLPKGD